MVKEFITPFDRSVFDGYVMYCADSTKPEVIKVVTPGPPLLAAAGVHVVATAWFSAPVHGYGMPGWHATDMHANWPTFPPVKRPWMEFTLMSVKVSTRALYTTSVVAYGADAQVVENV